MKVEINQTDTPPGITLITTKRVSTGWLQGLQRCITEIRGQKPSSDLFREITKTKEYPSIQSLMKEVCEEKFLSRTQGIVGIVLTGGIGITPMVRGISVLVSGTDTKTTGLILLGIGTIATVTGACLTLTGLMKHDKLESINDEVEKYSPTNNKLS